MKYPLVLLIFLLLISCSKGLNGLWIESRELSLLKFDSDSVVSNSLTNRFFLDTMAFKRDKDSIRFTGFSWFTELKWFTGPGWRFGGRTEESFRYILRKDSLQLWNRSGERILYLKSKSVNYKDHFLSKGNLNVKLPKADNVKCDFPTDRRYLDIRMGFKNEKITVFIDDEEINMQDLAQRIKDFLSKTDDWEIFGIECRLFIDEEVTCGDTFFVVDQLMANEIRRIRFITETERYNPYSSDFWGILLPGTGAISPLYKLKVSEENER